MGQRAQYTLRDGIGWIDLDDGKVNVMSTEMQDDISAALDEAERDGVVVVMRGRPGVFSAGFDLSVLGSGDQSSTDMVMGGFRLAHRVLGHPRPVVMACTGHAIAMGVFLLLSGDYRVGIDNSTKLAANEVAIGLTLPYTATEILRQRLTPAAFQRAALLAETFDPPSAVAAGILDEITSEEAFDDGVHAIAMRLTQLDVDAQQATKQRTRAALLDVLATAIAADQSDFAQRSTSSSTGDS